MKNTKLEIVFIVVNEIGSSYLEINFTEGLFQL